MNVTISSNTKENYLHIDAKGYIADNNEYKALQEEYYLEIIKHDFNAIIVDESKMILPKSLLAQNEVVDFYSEELPEEVKSWIIAAILPEDYIEIAKYWEIQANNSGYFGFKVFVNINDAKQYINTFI